MPTILPYGGLGLTALLRRSCPRGLGGGAVGLFHLTLDRVDTPSELNQRPHYNRQKD